MFSLSQNFPLQKKLKKKILPFLLVLLGLLTNIENSASSPQNNPCPPKKVRLILHLGPGKTGTSALQTFFSKNYEVLKEQGVLYPWPDQNQAQGSIGPGNFLALLPAVNHSPEDPCNDLLEDFFSKLDLECTPKIHTIVLSSEVLGEVSCEVWKNFLKKAKIRNFDVECIVSVREFYTWAFSWWGEHLRLGRYESFQEKPNEGFFKDLNLRVNAAINYKNIFPQFTIINYDFHKKDLIASFLKTMGISKECQKCQKDFSAKINRSLTLSEFNLVSLVNKTLKTILIMNCAPVGQKSIYFPHNFSTQNPHKKAFLFYDAQIAKQVYKDFEKQIKEINRLLPPDEQLPTKPHCPQGYVTTWDKNYMELDDMKVTIEYLATRINELTERPPLVSPPAPPVIEKNPSRLSRFIQKIRRRGSSLISFFKGSSVEA
jgi:hypothetical protein